MLGWNITVIRPNEPVLGPDDPRLDAHREGSWSSYISPDLDGDRVASWTAGLGGLDWIDPVGGEPAPSKQLRGGGYPSVYAVPAEVLLAGADRLSARPGLTNDSAVDLSAVVAMPPGEWIVVEAWDQS